MKPHQQRSWIFGVVSFFQHSRPDSSSGAELRNFLKEVHPTIEEEREAWCKIVDLQSSIKAEIDVREPVR